MNCKLLLEPAKIHYKANNLIMSFRSANNLQKTRLKILECQNESLLCIRQQKEAAPETSIYFHYYVQVDARQLFSLRYERMACRVWHFDLKIRMFECILRATTRCRCPQRSPKSSICSVGAQGCANPSSSSVIPQLSPHHYREPPHFSFC